MSITAFTGPPGSGKSHALMKDVVVPAIMAGRRVLTNIDGVDCDAVRAHCLERIDDAGKLGTLDTFHGDDAAKGGFWPDEQTTDAETVVKGGDLVVFDEWALTFPRRGAWPQGSNVEGFLRWHRHLNGADGTATDIAIGTQLATDVHPNVRGLIVKSYKFRKLTAIGAQGQYSWQLFEGHLQPKDGYYKNGTGTYDKAIFPLYASSAAAKVGKHVELRTNKKESIWSGGKAWAAIIVPILLLLGGGFGLWYSWGAQAAPVGVDAAAAASVPSVVGGSGSSSSVAPSQKASTVWRIVGQIDGEQGARVIVADDKGAVRMLKPDAFQFDEGRPVSGMVEGELTVAEDRLPAARATPFPGLGS